MTKVTDRPVWHFLLVLFPLCVSVAKTVVSSTLLFDFNVCSPTLSEHLHHDPNLQVGVEGNQIWRGTSRW